MSDSDRFIERPHPSAEPSSIVSQTAESGAGGQEAVPFEIGSQDRSDFHTPMRSLEADDPRNAQAEALHREVQAREATVDVRVEQLITEIKGLTAEPRHADLPGHSQDGPLESVRRYCQGVAGAIGGFFSAVFGHAEPKLDRNDAHIAEVARKIGLDVEELKSLQETRHAYEELDRRIGNLENTATPEQQETIAHTAENLDLHSRTREWLESLVHTLEGRTVPADASGAVGPIGPIGPDGTDTPGGPGRWHDLTPTEPGTTPAWPPEHRTPFEIPPVSPEPAVTPWRPIVPAHHETPLGPPDAAPWLPPTVPGHNDAPSFVPINPTPWRETAPPVPEHGGGLPEGTTVIGDQNEVQDDELVHPQGLNDYHDTGTCGVVTQEMILNRISGTHNYTEKALTNEAQEHGWFIPNGGTPLNQVGNLCEQHGLHVEHRMSNLQDLAEHLAKGDQAIVAVNAGKLGGAWESDPHAYGDGSANHAVWVSGIKVETHNGVSTVVAVKIHDSGIGRSYELTPEQFQQAWSASNDSAVYVSPGTVSRGAQLS